MSVRILRIELGLIASYVVDGFQVVDDLQLFARMWNTVTAAVSVFPFPTVLFYVLVFPADACLQVVRERLVLVGQVQCLHVAVQEIPGMFHVASYAQLLIAVCLVEPILALYVVRLLLFCAER